MASKAIGARDAGNDVQGPATPYGAHERSARSEFSSLSQPQESIITPTLVHGTLPQTRHERESNGIIRRVRGAGITCWSLDLLTHDLVRRFQVASALPPCRIERQAAGVSV